MTRPTFDSFSQIQRRVLESMAFLGNTKIHPNLRNSALIQTFSLGPSGLATTGTGIGGTTIPTVTDNLFAIGDIPLDAVSISFEPTTSEESLNGELTWGERMYRVGSYVLIIV